MMDYNYKKLNIVLGHYGSGKTNFCVNLALKLNKIGKNVTVIDLDIVNPYFRTSDFKPLFEQEGINLITPTFANTNLDVPALRGNVDAAILQANNDDNNYIIIDVGGDDAGATALGRYSNLISNQDYDCFYVMNIYRYLTQNTEQLIKLMQDIEYVSRIKINKIINNSNLANQTTKDTVLKSIETAKQLSTLSNTPLFCTCVKEDILKTIDTRNYDTSFLAVENYVKSL